ncbi:MAG: hypothetical protein J6V32_06235 [Elusimicrobiaceae bacterium]|nr:hypothetical protein [Elusimicrobiaceae bacterium]
MKKLIPTFCMLLFLQLLAVSAYAEPGPEALKVICNWAQRFPASSTVAATCQTVGVSLKVQEGAGAGQSTTNNETLLAWQSNANDMVTAYQEYQAAWENFLAWYKEQIDSGNYPFDQSNKNCGKLSLSCVSLGYNIPNPRNNEFYQAALAAHDQFEEYNLSFKESVTNSGSSNGEIYSWLTENYPDNIDIFGINPPEEKDDKELKK